MISQILDNPNLIYEIIRHLDYPSILEFVCITPSTNSLCRSSLLIRSVIFQKCVEDKIQRSNGDMKEVFFNAATKGNFSIVDEMIRRGVDPSTNDNEVILRTIFGARDELKCSKVMKRLFDDPRIHTSKSSYEIAYFAYDAMCCSDFNIIRMKAVDVGDHLHQLSKVSLNPFK